MKYLFASLAVVLAAAITADAQSTPLSRLPATVLDVLPPSARVAGAPGSMTIREASCRTLPTDQVRRRVVDLAVQEWGFFGFSVVDQTADDEVDVGPRRGRRPGRADTARTADSIAGYWTVAPGGDWILENQNAVWQRQGGEPTRWRYPWSAAFVSWVMCEGGLGASDQFQRAIAHHTYIDQAIRARDGRAARAAFAAYESGEVPVAPGDLLCTARRPAYTTLADRRRHMGEGARTHCDVVVEIDDAGSRFLAIGGNVRGTVSLKVLPAVWDGDRLRPLTRSELGQGRAVFAHLSLRVEPIAADALSTSATVRALGCAERVARLATLRVPALAGPSCAD